MARPGALRAPGLLIALGGLLAANALAAALSLTGSTLGAASSSMTRCSSGGLGVVDNVSSGLVVSVTISGLPSACGGATLQVTVNEAGSTGSGSATIPAGGGSTTIALGSSPALATAGETDLVIVGP